MKRSEGRKRGEKKRREKRREKNRKNRENGKRRGKKILVCCCRDMRTSALGLDDATMGIQLPLEFRIRTSLKSTVVLLNPECYRGNKRRTFGCIGGPKLKSCMLCLRICLDFFFRSRWMKLFDSEFLFVTFWQWKYD